MQQGYGLREGTSAQSLRWGSRAADPRVAAHRVQEAASVPASPSVLARVGLALAVLVTSVTLVVAAAVIWLCLTQPLNVADVMGRGEIFALFRAVAEFLISAVERAAHYL